MSSYSFDKTNDEILKEIIIELYSSFDLPIAMFLHNSLDYWLSLIKINQNYHYHNISHTLDVISRTLYLSKKENINNREKILLVLSAIFHDTGFSVQYESNESIWLNLLLNYINYWIYSWQHEFNLLSFNKNIRSIVKFSEKDKDLMSWIIMATKLFSTPKNILEWIIQDADLDNLGRKDFFDKTQAVKQELQIFNKKQLSEKDILSFSLSILESFSFNTSSAKLEREQQRLSNISELKFKIKNIF